jgi:hypothetical protein
MIIDILSHSFVKSRISHHQSVDVETCGLIMVEEPHGNGVYLRPSHKAHDHQFCKEPHVLCPLTPKILPYLFHHSDLQFI